MNTYILLFRGINVGGNNLLPMKTLTALMEELGYQNVKTYIQSGNVVLKNNELPNDEVIKQTIETQFGFTPEPLILDHTALEKAFDGNPYLADEGKTIHFFFLADQAVPDEQRLAAESEQLHLNGWVFYLYAPDGIGRSKLAAKVESCLQVAATARNFNTVKKLMAMSAD